MRFNDREIAMKGAGSVDLEGLLHYLRPQNNDWSNWYSAPSFKERKFKLIYNILFYYRVGDTDPQGLIILENATVKHEKPSNGVVFPFSIEFADEMQRKYLFSCRCQEEANQWVATLKNASYEYWRLQLIILQKKISMRTGLDPLTFYSRNQGTAERLEWSKDKKIVAYKSSFQCHLDKNDKSSIGLHKQQNSDNPFYVSQPINVDPEIGNLIEF